MHALTHVQTQAKSTVPGPFSSSPQKGPGDEASRSHDQSINHTGNKHVKSNANLESADSSYNNVMYIAMQRLLLFEFQINESTHRTMIGDVDFTVALFFKLFLSFPGYL